MQAILKLMNNNYYKHIAVRASFGYIYIKKQKIFALRRLLYKEDWSAQADGRW